MKLFLDKEVGALEPTRRHGQDAGYDFKLTKETTFKAKEWTILPTGIRSLFDEDTALIAFNKSGKATKNGLMVGACVVDSAYQGIIHIHLYNTTDTDWTFPAGEKIVQFVPVKIDSSPAEIITSDEMTVEEFYKDHNSERGSGGFGSTDKK